MHKLAALLMAGFLGAFCCLAEAPDRVAGEIRGDRTYALRGSMRPMLALATDTGEADDDLPLTDLAIHFSSTAQQEADLTRLLLAQQTPGSSDYHRFLSPEEFAERFGASSSDAAKVMQWLASQGFTNVALARSRTFVRFQGTAAIASAAFHTSIHRYRLGSARHFANASNPVLPLEMQGLVASVRGLHNFTKRPLGIRHLESHWTSDVSGNHFLAPADIATIYNIAPLYQSGLDGTGVNIAVAGQSNIQLSDIRAFRAAAGLPARDPTVVLAGTDPGLQDDDQSEADLDVEWAGAVAKGASVILVTSPDVTTSISYAIDMNVAPILSISYGLCESEMGQAEINTEAALYSQANAHGMTVIAASGDTGAADCDNTAPATRGLGVDFPASSPNVTGIGGTVFNEGTGTYWSATNSTSVGSALSYIPEAAWNDSGSSLSASGGGASLFFSKPNWQAAPGVPNDGVRDVPDISFAASPSHDGFLICSAGSCVNGFRKADTTLDVIGGTSCGAPLFSGIVALLVQGHGAQGNVNPGLYTTASGSPSAIHDVTSGTNNVACRLGTIDCANGSVGYSTAAGFDLVTGLGSVDAAQLYSVWKYSNTPLTATPTPTPLSFVPVTPCRVADTRNANGAFGGPALPADSTREFDIPSSSCGIPANALAYAVNATVVPQEPLTFLTLWPSGQSRPIVSTLNSDGRIKANAAIVAAGTNGGVSVYVTNTTDFVLDINGYFVPTSSTGGLQFFPVTPCRVLDTRADPSGFIPGGQTRDVAVTGACGVPTSAQAYSLNVTAVPRKPLFYVSVWPSGQAQPLVSTLNALSGTYTANAAIIPASAGGKISTFVTDDTDLVVDINGYLAPAASGGNYLYITNPCRAVDTRNPIGSSPQSGVTTQDLQASGCGVPSNAQAYVTNATVVPQGRLDYLTLWPSGQAMPLVSTLNADPATTTSNLAILPTTNGVVGAFATAPTYLVLDISGYFAP